VVRHLRGGWVLGFEKSLLPETPYEPYSEKPALSEPPYQPYAEKPERGSPYEPYKGL
jgi:hypothetical protein